jgi:tRNA(adenine34) deaminase
MEHERFMRRCLELAVAAMAEGDVPVGALIVDGDRIVSEGMECRRALVDPAAHAELRAIQAACRIRRTTTLTGVTLYSTVEPCVLCGYVVRSVGVGTVVYGVPAGRLGACTSLYRLLTDAAIPGWSSPPRIVSGILRDECAALIDKYASATRIRVNASEAK